MEAVVCLWKVKGESCLDQGRSCAFQAEGKRTFSWVQQEGHVNEATVTKLHERYKWKRTTINGDRSF